jgi:hypothetical protein
MQMRRLGYLLTLLLAMGLCSTISFAQDGKLKVKVTPKQAYVFVDGQAIRDGSQSVSLPAGKHTVVVVNYGYKMESRDVNIDAGKSTPLEVTLTAYGGPVAGPFGLVMIERGPWTSADAQAAVLSEGTKPDYFVGHVDEFNHDWWWHQNLLLPPGTHHLTVTLKGKTLFSGDVNVVANKKTVIHLNQNGKQTTADWPRGEKLKDLARFKAGTASATVAVAPVTGSFSVSAANINCGQTSALNWQSTDAVDANISGIGAVQPSGNQTVEPHATTTYDFSATGPGGTVKGTGTVNVNTAVQASLSANPTELKYRKIGEKVLAQDSSTLTWNTSNASNVTLDGNQVQPSGNQTVKPDPSNTGQVPEGQPTRTIDENKTYTLNATNVCGGSGTQSASLHITGTVEPIPTVTLQSIFYPTDYPDKKNPQVGLVKSQQLELATTAAGFKKYLEYDPDAKVSVEAYTDVRGSKPYNQDLSERRVERIKQYLIDQGVAADKVETAAYGKDRPLPQDQVVQMEGMNPQMPPTKRFKTNTAKHNDWLAYNRRADIILQPSGKKSTQYFPHGADDSDIIWQVPKPPLKKVEAAQ